MLNVHTEQVKGDEFPPCPARPAPVGSHVRAHVGGGGSRVEQAMCLREQTEQTAGFHTHRMAAVRCHGAVAPTAPRIPGGQSGYKLETVCDDLIPPPPVTHTQS